MKRKKFTCKFSIIFYLLPLKSHKNLEMPTRRHLGVSVTAAQANIECPKMLFVRVENIFKPLTLKKRLLLMLPFWVKILLVFVCRNHSPTPLPFSQIYSVVCDDIVCAWVPVCHSLAICKNTKFPHFQSLQKSDCDDDDDDDDDAVMRKDEKVLFTILRSIQFSSPSHTIFWIE